MQPQTIVGAVLAAFLIALLYEGNQKIGALVLALVVIALLSRAYAQGQLKGTS